MARDDDWISKSRFKTPKKKLKGNKSASEIARARGWRRKFSAEERTQLKLLLKDKFSEQLIADLEARACEYFDTAAKAHIHTESFEMERAKAFRLASARCLHLLSVQGTGGAYQHSITSFESFMRDRLGSEFLGYFRLLEHLHALSAEYVSTTVPSKRPPGDGFKWLAAHSVGRDLAKAGVRRSKGRGTVFYQLYQTWFALLGKDGVENPDDYVAAFTASAGDIAPKN